MAVYDVDCYYLDGHTDGLRFIAPWGFEPWDAMSRTEKVGRGLHVIWPLVQPLRAEVTMECADHEYGIADHRLAPPRLRSGIQESGHRATDTGAPDPAVPHLTIEVLQRWLEQAETQTAPTPETHCVRWGEIHFRVTRVRLADVASTGAATVPDVFRLWQDHRLEYGYDIPCEIRDGSTWVVGRRDLILPRQTPVSVRVIGDVGSTVWLELDVHWSSWRKQDSPHRSMLVDIGLALVADGWWIDYAAPAFPEFHGLVADHRRHYRLPA